MRKLLTLFFLLFLFSNVGSAKKKQDTRFQNLLSHEPLLKKMGERILSFEKFSKRDSLQKVFQEKLKTLLSDPNSFDFPFKNVPSLSKFTASDKTFRIFTWVLPLEDRKINHHFGFLQLKNKKGVRIIELADYSNFISDIEKRILDASFWYGALYYELIGPIILNSKKIFFLLGWNGSHKTLNRKTIETFSISNSGDPQFGSFIFPEKEKKIARKIFFYSKEARMSLKYDQKKKMIVFDHLSPSSKKHQGEFKHYGPDFSYDGYEIKEKEIIFHNDVSINNDN